jgi:hypothetical protein
MLHKHAAKERDTKGTKQREEWKNGRKKGIGIFNFSEWERTKFMFTQFSIKSVHRNTD